MYLRELIEQKKALEALIERNQVAIKREKDVSQSGVELPFLVVQVYIYYILIQCAFMLIHAMCRRGQMQK